MDRSELTEIVKAVLEGAKDARDASKQVTRRGRVGDWLTKGWDKFVVGLVASVLLALLASAKGWMTIAVNDVQEASIATRLADNEKFRASIQQRLSLLPAGCVVAWPTAASQVPNGWHPCDGTRVKFCTDLWTALRGRYGNPDALTVAQIILPDLQGKFLTGADKDTVPGSVGGRADIPNAVPLTPKGTVFLDRGPQNRDGLDATQGARSFAYEAKFTGAPLQDHDHGGENRPPYCAVCWIIKIN